MASVRALFSEHEDALRLRRERRREQLTLKSITADPAAGVAAGAAAGGGAGAAGAAGAAAGEGALGFEGDHVLQTLYALLADIDRRGFARSAHQLQFHNAFIRACGRVLYRNDWGTSRPAIMEKNGWAKSPSEILISTPRRFGKTFSCAKLCDHSLHSRADFVPVCLLFVFAASPSSARAWRFRLRSRL